MTAKAKNIRFVSGATVAKRLKRTRPDIAKAFDAMPLVQVTAFNFRRLITERQWTVGKLHKKISKTKGKPVSMRTLKSFASGKESGAISRVIEAVAHAFGVPYTELVKSVKLANLLR